METYLDNVAVIGAGLGGCAIALALSQKHIPVTVYEARPASALSMQSGVLLTPNGLHVLDQLGVLSRIRDRCYIPTHRVFKNDNDEITKKDRIDSEEKYGYANHRIWRHFLLAEMRLMLKELSVPIHFDSKFNGIVSDTTHGVVFQINDSTHSTSLLIASDGIYSAVRKHLAPDIHPSYTGITAVAGHARFDEIDWPDQTHHHIDRNATIQSKPGAIFYIAEDPAGEEAMFATQAHFPEQSRQDLEDLQASPERMLAFFTERYAEWGETARRIIDAVERNKESLFIWPFMRMPALPRWYSETGRIVLVGDGAHALPPSSAQGVNQALEDAWSLGFLLDTFQQQRETKGMDVEASKRLLLEVLERWQKWRQGKIDEIFEWTENTTNVGRLAEGERRKLVEEGRVRDSHGDEMGWLFWPGIEEGVRGFFEGEG